jgi:CheY-like chemotaxis protein
MGPCCVRDGPFSQWMRRHESCALGSTSVRQGRASDPRMRSLPSAAPAASTSSSTLEAPLILVVDDDEDTRFLYTAALADMGYRTAGECDGARGAEAAARLVPYAILMDITMPVMNGIDATHRIKEDSSQQRMPRHPHDGTRNGEVRRGARRRLRRLPMQAVHSASRSTSSSVRSRLRSTTRRSRCVPRW